MTYLLYGLITAFVIVVCLFFYECGKMRADQKIARELYRLKHPPRDSRTGRFVATETDANRVLREAYGTAKRVRG